MPTFTYSSQFNFPVEKLFGWHEQPGAFIRLMPPWEPVDIIQKAPSLAVGSQAIIKMKSFPYSTLTAEHFAYQPPNLFADKLISGPFKSWQHFHRFSSVSDNQSSLTDEINFELPLGILVGKHFVTERLSRMFLYRHQVTTRDIQNIELYPFEKKKIAVTGSTGLVGTQLCAFLENAGHEVVRLTRSPDQKDSTQYRWSIEEGIAEPAVFDNLDVLIHLAGENIGAHTWSDSFKQKIKHSRVDSTRKLVSQLAGLTNKPPLFICASAIGYYGDRGSDTLPESMEPAQDFLAQTCVQWEQAAQYASEFGIRVVNARIGVVLSPQGSILHSLIPIFNKLLGGPVGSGEQYISWIAIDDLIYAFYRLIMDKSVIGPVNMVSPHPVTNKEFSQSLAKVLGKPAVVPTPSMAIKTLYGEMGEAIILSSTRVIPLKLQLLNHQFIYPQLEPALRHLLGHVAVPTVSN